MKFGQLFSEVVFGVIEIITDTLQKDERDKYKWNTKRNGWRVEQILM